MSNKSLLILATITLVIIIAATVSTRQRAPQTVVETPLLSPELKSGVNDVSQIIIESSDSAVHISRQDNDWVVMQSDNYPAQFDKVKKLVLDTADLTILSQKTSNPDLFRELGLEDHTTEAADSNLLTLLDSSGNAIASLVIGNRQGTTSLYVRQAGTNNTYEVKGQPDVSADPEDWIIKELLNVDNERIMEVSIEHPGGETVVLKRGPGEEDFVLQTIPEGRKARSSYFTNQPGTFLADLRIQNAKSREGFSFPEPQVVTTVRTYDGLVATVRAAKIDNINHAAITFSFDDSRVQESTEGQEEIVIGEQPDEAPDVRQEAEELNDKVRQWVFIIPQSKYLLLTKRAEELTDVIEEGSENTP